jgi:hypothetical protein
MVMGADQDSAGKESAMKRMGGLVTVLAVVVVAGCGVSQTAHPRPVTHRTKLKQDTVIQGYPCAKGYQWFYADGQLSECFISRDIDVGEAHIPKGSIIQLFPVQDVRRRLIGVMLNHDTVISGVRCSGGNWLLGPAEGAGTTLYPNGKLYACSLVEDQVVQGVPCRHDDGPVGILYGLWVKHQDYDLGIEFYPSGKLKSCGLAEDFGGQKKNTLWKSAAK